MTNEYICVLLIQEFSIRMSCANEYVYVCTIERACVNVFVCVSASSSIEGLALITCICTVSAEIPAVCKIRGFHGHLLIQRKFTSLQQLEICNST